MEPVGSWFSAVSYNRFSGNQQCGIQNGSFDSELFSTGVVSAPQPQGSSSSQLFFGGAHHSGSNLSGPTVSPFPPPPPPSGVLSPAPVTVPYDSSVFNSIFHQKSHYRAFKQPEMDNFNYMSTQGNGGYFDQGCTTPMAWGQNSQLQSPFGVLPHESAIQTGTVVKPYDNLVHFNPQTLNQFNNQPDYKNFDYDNRNYSSSLRPNPPTLLSQAVDDYQKFHKAHFQHQSFVSTQDSRLSQASLRGNHIIARNDHPYDCGPHCIRPIYPPEPKACNLQLQDQSSPISYALFDNQRHFEGNRGEPPHFINQLTYNRFGSIDDCVEKSCNRGMKGLSDSYGLRPSVPYDNGCPSYCQSSPVTQSSSNSSPSPIDPSSIVPSVQQPQEFETPVSDNRVMSPVENPPIDVSIPRPLPYMSAVPPKPLADRTFIQPRAHNESWQGREKQNISAIPVQRSVCTPIDASQITYHYKDLTNCRDDPMSLVKTLQQQNYPPSHFSEQDKKFVGSGGNWRGPDIFHRIPPPAHHNAFNQVQNGYFDFDRWNSAKMFAAPSGFPSSHAPPSNGKFSLHSTPGPHHPPTYLKSPPPYPPSSAIVPPKGGVPLFVTQSDDGINGNVEKTNESDEEESIQDNGPSQNVATPNDVATNKPQKLLSIKEELDFLDTAPSSPTRPPAAKPQLNPKVGFSKEFFKFLERKSSRDARISKKETGNGKQEKLSSSKNVELKPNSTNKISSHKIIAESSKENIGAQGLPDVRRQSSNCVPQVPKCIEFPFSFGEFVVVKSDRLLLHPPLWKVKKNQLLQKFTHFVSRGVAFYSNVPIFTGWSPLSKKVYEKVAVIVVKQQKEDATVKLPNSNLLSDTDDRKRQDVKKYEGLKESFEVYVQALFSQALDSKFLKEIMLDKDEYFLNNVRTVESFWDEMIDRLKRSLSWDQPTIALMTKSPNYRFVDVSSSSDKCVCSLANANTCISLGGLPYSLDTLELMKLPIPHQNMALCNECKVNFELLHKLSHQKYLLFSICENIVTKRKNELLRVDPRIILTDILKDGNWFKQIFHEFSKLWEYAECHTDFLMRDKKFNAGTGKE